MKIQKSLSVAMLAVLTSTSVLAEENVPKAVAVPTAEAKPAKAVPAKSEGTEIEKVKSGVRPLNVTTDLNTNTTIAGTLVEVDVLLIKTAFGEASIPLSEIAGIRFPQGDDVSTSVAMLNGDSITGATDVKLVTIETDWGTAKVNGSSIRSILFVPNVQWAAAPSISGKRWALQDVKAATPGQSGVATTQTAPTTSNSSGTVIPTNNNRGFFPNSQ
jgi:hypothetical protein